MPIARNTPATQQEAVKAGYWRELRHHIELRNKIVENGNSALADQPGVRFHEKVVKLSKNTVVQEIHAQLTRYPALLRTRITDRFEYPV